MTVMIILKAIGTTTRIRTICHAGNFVRRSFTRFSSLAAIDRWSDSPHEAQRLSTRGFPSPHARQTTNKCAPQLWQVFLEALFCVRHFAQRMLRPELFLPGTI
jgi:hypothetical protein